LLRPVGNWGEPPDNITIRLVSIFSGGESVPHNAAHRNGKSRLFVMELQPAPVARANLWPGGSHMGGTNE
jgi:hypothetical protein